MEGDHPELPEFPVPDPTLEDVAIANILVPHIRTAPRCSWGIGSMPNVVGLILAQSDGVGTWACTRSSVVTPHYEASTRGES